LLLALSQLDFHSRPAHVAFAQRRHPGEGTNRALTLLPNFDTPKPLNPRRPDLCDWPPRSGQHSKPKTNVNLSLQTRLSEGEIRVRPGVSLQNGSAHLPGDCRTSFQSAPTGPPSDVSVPADGCVRKTKRQTSDCLLRGCHVASGLDCVWVFVSEPHSSKPESPRRARKGVRCAGV